jgi:hypothetical protein
LGHRRAPTIAVRWKLTVAGGIASTSDRTPPRRTGTVPDLLGGETNRYRLAVVLGGCAGHLRTSRAEVWLLVLGYCRHGRPPHLL